MFRKACLLLLLLVLWPVGAMADWQQSVSAEVEAEETYDSNVYNLAENEQEGWTTALSPLLRWQASQQDDNVSIAYAPVFQWFHWRDERSEEHQLDVTANKQLSRHFFVHLEGDYTYYDEAPGDMGGTGLIPPGDCADIEGRFSRAEFHIQAEVAHILFPSLYPSSSDYEDQDDYLFVLANICAEYATASSVNQARVSNLLSDTGERRRHDQFSTGFELEYEYLRNSVLMVGYTFEKLLDDDSSAFSPRQTHTPRLSIGYWFNEQWQLALESEWSDTDYKDATPEETAKEIRLGMDFFPSARNNINAEYGWRVVDYKDQRGDFATSTGEIGWLYHLSPRLEFDGRLAAIYDDREGAAGDQRRVEAEVGLTGQGQRLSWSCTGGTTFGELKRLSKWQNDRRDYDADLELHYQLVERLRAGVTGRWQEQHAWTLATDVKRRVSSYDIGADVSWALWQHWSLEAEYTFHDQTSGVLSNYHDHLVSLRIIWTEELWRF